MSDEINYKHNPLNGVGLKQLVTELVDHYGFEILFAYLNINCFKTNASVESSIKFLKKTEWAREKVEAFYMYEYKNLPRASKEQFALPPRDRIVPDEDQVGEPTELNLEDAEERRQESAQKAADWNRGGGRARTNDKKRSKPAAKPGQSSPWKSSGGNGGSTSSSSSSSSAGSSSGKVDPWANSRK